MDQESRKKLDQFTRAKEEMFRQTSIPEAPWMIFKSDNKKQARINSIRYFLGQFDYPGKNAELLGYDRAVVQSVDEAMGSD